MQTVGKRAFLEEQTACARVLRFTCGQSQEEGVLQGMLSKLGRPECAAMRMSLNEPMNISC